MARSAWQEGEWIQLLPRCSGSQWASGRTAQTAGQDCVLCRQGLLHKKIYEGMAGQKTLGTRNCGDTLLSLR